MAAEIEYDYLWSHPKEIGKHLGKWIMIVGKEIVATALDEDFEKTIAEVRKKHPGKHPLVVRFPKETVTLF